MATYEAEAEALERAYWVAVGDALELGILVFVPGPNFRMKALGELRDEVAAERKRREFGSAAEEYIERLLRELEAVHLIKFDLPYNPGHMLAYFNLGHTVKEHQS